MNNTFRLNLLASALTSTALMSGCVFNSEITKEAEVHYVESQDYSSKSIGDIRAEVKQAKSTPSQKYWDNDSPILNVSEIPLIKPLPSKFKNHVDFVEPFEVSLDNFLIKASSVMGIKIEVENDVRTEMESASAIGSESAPGSDAMDATGAKTGESSSLFSEDMSGPRLSLNQSGTVEELMNSIASLLGAKWKYNEDANKIIVYKYVSKNFYIPSIPGGYTLGSKVAGSNASNEASFNTTQSVWASIREDVGVMVGDKGNFTLSESSGILTVRANSVVLDRVETYIDSVKKGMRSQILIDVQILSVIQDKLNRKDLNLQAVFTEAGLSSTFKGAAGSILTGASSFIIGNEMNVLPENRKGLAGSQTMIDLLEKYGTTAVVASNTIRTVNNQPSALTTSDTESYLLKKEVTIGDTNGTTQTNLTVEEKTTGLSLHILPTLDENGKDILLQISFTLSKIKGYNTYDGGDGNQVNTPIISSRDFVEKVWLRSGETLVLSGFDIAETSKEGSGALGKDMWALGGSSQDTVKREKLVIIITPAAYNAVTQNKL